MHHLRSTDEGDDVRTCTDRCRWAAGSCWNPDRDIRRIHNALSRMRGNQIAADLRNQIDLIAADWYARPKESR